MVNRTEYKNRHRKEHYDTILFVFPKGKKNQIKAVAEDLNMSVNEYLYSLVCEDLASGESKLGKKKQGFNEEHRRLLDKWQVAQKYRDMIESMHVEEINGMNKHYTIVLKKGYINDISGGRTIHCDKTAELRRIIVHSHKK